MSEERKVMCQEPVRVPLSEQGKTLIVHDDGRIEVESCVKGLTSVRALIQSLSNRGYRRVNVTENKKLRHVCVHRLLAECFIPNPDNKPQINHINGDKTDNTISNLEWTTGDENLLHAMKNGLIKTRPVVRKSKETGEITRYRSAREAEKATGTGNDTIGHYCRRSRGQQGEYEWRFEY